MFCAPPNSSHVPRYRNFNLYFEQKLCNLTADLWTLTKNWGRRSWLIENGELRYTEIRIGCLLYASRSKHGFYCSITSLPSIPITVAHQRQTNSVSPWRCSCGLRQLTLRRGRAERKRGGMRQQCVTLWGIVNVRENWVYNYTSHFPSLSGLKSQQATFYGPAAHTQ